MATLYQVWHCRRCDFSQTIANNSTAAGACPRCGGTQWWQGIKPYIEPRAPVPPFVVHVAGDPHEGLQACRRCAAVIIEEGENAFPSEEFPAVRFFPAGAEITVGPGVSAIGADPRGVPCR